MPAIQDVCQFLEHFAPTRLAEDWDNVGLLAGDRSADVHRLMTCLTITPDSAAEAIERKCNLIVSHHPLPFQPIKQLTTDQTASRLLWELVRSGVAIYSPHTGFDSAAAGINQSLLVRLGAANIQPLVPIPDDPDELGAGRVGTIESQESLDEFVERVKSCFGLPGMHLVRSSKEPVFKIATACGSGGSFLSQAVKANCDTFVTGETNFHTCLEAQARKVNLVLLGHYASERFAVEMLADELNKQFSNIEVWASEKESDPLTWV